MILTIITMFSCCPNPKRSAVIEENSLGELFDGKQVEFSFQKFNYETIQYKNVVYSF
jgi:hypothetical protein